MSQVDNLSVDQLWDAVCLATKEKEGIWSHRDCKGMGVCQNLLADGTSVPPTTDCGGTGRVWALPGMQARCPAKWANHSAYFTYERFGIDLPDCVTCHGTGWVAMHDVWALLNTLSEYRLDWSRAKPPLAAYEMQIENALRRGDEMAFFRAVAQALVARGVVVVL